MKKFTNKESRLVHLEFKSLGEKVKAGFAESPDSKAEAAKKAAKTDAVVARGGISGAISGALSGNKGKPAAVATEEDPKKLSLGERVKKRLSLRERVKKRLRRVTKFMSTIIDSEDAENSTTYREKLAKDMERLVLKEYSLKPKDVKDFFKKLKGKKAEVAKEAKEDQEKEVAKAKEKLMVKQAAIASKKEELKVEIEGKKNELAQSFMTEENVAALLDASPTDLDVTTVKIEASVNEPMGKVMDDITGKYDAIASQINDGTSLMTVAGVSKVIEDADIAIIELEKENAPAVANAATQAIASAAEILKELKPEQPSVYEDEEALASIDPEVLTSEEIEEPAPAEAPVEAPTEEVAVATAPSKEEPVVATAAEEPGLSQEEKDRLALLRKEFENLDDSTFPIKAALALTEEFIELSKKMPSDGYNDKYLLIRDIEKVDRLKELAERNIGKNEDEKEEVMRAKAIRLNLEIELLKIDPEQSKGTRIHDPEKLLASVDQYVSGKKAIDADYKADDDKGITEMAAIIRTLYPEPTKIADKDSRKAIASIMAKTGGQDDLPKEVADPSANFANDTDRIVYKALQGIDKKYEDMDEPEKTNAEKILDSASSFVTGKSILMDTPTEDAITTLAEEYLKLAQSTNKKAGKLKLLQRLTRNDGLKELAKIEIPATGDRPEGHTITGVMKAKELMLRARFEMAKLYPDSVSKKVLEYAKANYIEGKDAAEPDYNADSDEVIMALNEVGEKDDDQGTVVASR